MNKYEKIQEAVRQHLSETGKSQNVLARTIGISPATLSNILSGKWKNISPEMWNLVAAYLKVEFETNWQIMETPNFQIIRSVCQDAQAKKKFIAIAGFTGAGKTVALTSYAAKNQNVSYVLCTVTMTQKDFLRAIQQAMGVDDAGSIHTMVESIVSRMRASGDALLILDDAGKLRDSNFQLLQQLYDQTKDTAGIVLTGTDYLKSYVDKQASKDKKGFRELKRRIEFWQPMRRPTSDIIAGFCQHYGITDTKAVAYITSSAADYGTLYNYITNATEVSKRTGEPITRQLLEKLRVGSSEYQSA